MIDILFPVHVRGSCSLDQRGILLRTNRITEQSGRFLHGDVNERLSKSTR